eukprot:TRINITY_DN4435_c0_g1_i4.p1 TRINITY_DN4435_c0_g1~~TRINITY_DN4435_c0_g1_i4.p1  ORF type:complete len:645 (-),score=159.00 TRINITY_DN4435_c0_g1_i4:29-1963(-)
MRAVVMSLLFTILLVSGCQAAYVWTLPTNASLDEQTVLLAVQGIANKAAPTLYYIEPVFWSNPTSTMQFKDYFTSSYNFTFIPINGSVCDVVTSFKRSLKGLVVFDPNIDATRYLALTIAGLDSVLPVNANMMSSMPCLGGLPVVKDFRGQFSANLDAVQWGIDTLLPLCSPSSVYSAGQSHDDIFMGGDPAIFIGVDHAVRDRMFVFNLSPTNESFSIGGKTYPGHPADAHMWDKVMQSFKAPLINVFGWAEPEPAFAMRVSLAGNIILCDGAPNLSFWAGIGGPAPKLPMHTTDVKFDSSKYYFFMQTNEADTPKVLTAIMMGQWLDSRRGSTPISWGVDPLLGALFPALLRYYADTATPNDHWFAGCSGSGYSYPWVMPDMDVYAQRTGKLLEAIGPNVVDIWHAVSDFSDNMTQFQEFKDNAGASLQMFTHEHPNIPPPQPMARNDYTPDGTPVFTTHPDLFYPDLNKTDPWGDLQRKIQVAMQPHPPPFFLFTYGFLASPYSVFDAAYHVRQLFPQFVFVGLQDVVRLARQASFFQVKVNVVTAGSHFTIDVTVRNPSGGPDEEGDAGVVSVAHVDPACTLLDSTAMDWTYGHLRDGSSLHYTWHVLCDEPVEKIATLQDTRDMDDNTRTARAPSYLHS